MAPVAGGEPQKAPLVIVAAQVAVAEPLPDVTPQDILAIFAIVKHHFAVGGKDSESQRIVVEMAVFNLFLCPHLWREGMELVEIHRAQAAGEQQLLGIEQLIQLIGGLLPGHKAGNAPGGAGQQQKKQRQADA